MDKIDLDAIIKEHMPFVIHGNSPGPYIGVRKVLKEGISQDLMLASEKATTEEGSCGYGVYVTIVKKQSILDVINLVE